jgi:hypothetical protein
MNDQLIEWLTERLDSSAKNLDASRAIAPNSHGAGYDLGFHEALRETLALVTDPTFTAGQQPCPSSTS